MSPQTKSGLIALITTQSSVAESISNALDGIYQVKIYENGLSLHHSMEKGIQYLAIISDAELRSANGIPLLNTLISLGYGKIPFVSIVKQIDGEQRKLAMQEGVAELLTHETAVKAISIRIPYLINNFSKAGITETFKNKPFHLPLIKRLFDIFFSGMALIFLSPVFLIIAILIRAESKGKVFYFSLRVGTGYQIFKFYKFRSMFTGADAKLKELSHLNQYNTEKPVQVSEEIVKELCDLCEQAGSGCQNALFADNKMICEKLHKQQLASKVDSAFIKIKDDPRITKIGKFIRNTSIDELPQLWNVFIGDMSIVGNRPLPLYEAEKITTDKYALRFMAPAGITGLWQVEKRGRGEMSEEERLNLDNNYAKTHSFFNDIRLILRTIPALFQSENV